jgi:hypothetical protein
VNRILGYLGRFILIVAGFGAASVVASAFLHLLVLGGFDWRDDEMRALLAGSILFSVPVVAAFVGYVAFVPAAVLVLVAELAGLRGWLFHVGAGAAVGAAAGLLFEQPEGPTSSFVPDAGFVLALTACGMVGGWAYWLVAGRESGDWLYGRRDAVSGPGPSGS